MDHFTERSTTSFGQNIGGSLKGIVFGLLFLIGSMIFLWWNESRSVNQADALNEMRINTVVLPDTRYYPEYKDKPVWVYGEIIPLKALEDTLFNVKSEGLSLKRNVEMYQWREHKNTKTEDKLGGGTETITTYDYTKEWSIIAVDSSSFRHPAEHINPQMLYQTETFVTDAKLGEFYLSNNLVASIYPSETYTGLSSLPEQVGMAKNYKSFLYIGENPQTPKVGDIKVSYTQASSGLFSVVAKEQAETLVPYRSSNDKEFFFVRRGNVALGQIFQQELDQNATLTWIFRAIGLGVMFLGFSLIMGPLVALSNVVPMFGSLVDSVTGIIAAIFTLLVGSVIIALAWFGARPMLSIGILVAGVLFALGLSKFRKKKQTLM
ncbi:MAG TPA: hypothetical protein ENO02_02865 [Epsilonproteobacteria bacterium]|nr:hypothetical protein [Campylobacterota bacterium]